MTAQADVVAPVTAARRTAVAARVFGLSARLQLSDTLSAGPTLVLTVLQPALLLLVVLAPVDPATTDVGRLVVGVLLTAFWSSTVWGAANVLRRDRVVGALPRLAAGQVDPVVVVLGKGLSASAVSVVLVLVTTTVGLLLARLPIAVPAPGWTLLGLVVTVLSGACVSLLVGVVYVRTRHAHQVASALMYPVMLLGGMLVPVETLPSWLQWVPVLLPVSWLTEFLASTLDDAPDLAALAAAAGTTVVYLVLGAWAMRRTFARARQGGSLDLY